jgi:8-oxo-dGTP diphosphatase
MKIIKVVCGIIWKDDKVFIARRKQGKSLAGFWEFPGGKPELNETLEQALVRELDEELGMKVNVSFAFGNNVHHYETFSIELIAFVCSFISTNNTSIDHDKVAFVTPEDLSNYQIAPADIYFVNKLLAAK